MRAFDETSLKAISDAVTEAERSTSGEIVVVVAPRSSGYDGLRAAVAIVVTTLLALAVTLLWPALHASWIALALPVVFIAAYATAAAPALLRLVLSRDDAEAAVADGARLAFIDRGVHRTRDRSGVLVYISLLERRVQVLGDAGIHDVIGEAGWQKTVTRIVEALVKREPAAIADVVRDMGATLSASFPRRADDKNELPDQVVVAQRP